MDSATLVMLAGAVLIAAVFPLLGRVGHAGRSRRQVVYRAHRQGRRDRHRRPGRRGPLARKRANPVRGAFLPRHAFDGLRPDQDAALLPQHLHEDELVAGNALIEAAHFSRSSSARSLAEAWSCSPKGRLSSAPAALSVRSWVGLLHVRSRAAPSSAADAPRPRLLRDTSLWSVT